MRSNGTTFNAAAIPDALAEEVADYVHAKFVLDRIQYTEPSVFSAEQQDASGVV